MSSALSPLMYSVLDASLHIVSSRCIFVGGSGPYQQCSISTDVLKTLISPVHCMHVVVIKNELEYNYKRLRIKDLQVSFYKQFTMFAPGVSV